MSAEEPKIPRRQWLMLVLVSVLSAGIMVVTVEFTARHVYYASKTTTLPCLVTNDASTGVRGIPNTRCAQKMFESNLIEYTLNNCGHRAGKACGPKSPGTYRIVLVGSSFAYGMWVPQEKSFAALLPVELARRTGREIELYNESMQWGTPRSVDLRFEQAVAARPDMVLWTLTPFDIENVDLTVPWIPPPAVEGGTHDASTHGGILGRVMNALTRKTPVSLVRDAWRRLVMKLDDTRTVFAFQHLLYQSQSQYVKHFVMQGEPAEFLRNAPDEVWKSQLTRLETYVADLERRATSSGAILVVTLLPQRAQAAMLSSAQWPAGFDPYKLGEDVRTIAERQGATYVDVLHGMRRVPNAAMNYYPVDGHADENGQAVFSRLLSTALLPEVEKSPPGYPTK